MPITQAPYDPNRGVWAPKADEVWAKLRQGRPLVEQAEPESTDDADDATTDDGSETDVKDNATGEDGNQSSSANGEANEPGEADGETGESTGESSEPATPQPDPVSGLITDEYGNLIDPETGGIVDPETGAIRDIETGQFVGLADQYLNNVVCATPSEE